VCPTKFFFCVFVLYAGARARSLSTADSGVLRRRVSRSALITSMPLLSITTAAHARYIEYATETLEAVGAVVLPAGWDLEWVVQEDATARSWREVLPNSLPNGAPVYYQSNTHHAGIALTKNQALFRAHGSRFMGLDCDDVVLPGGPGVLLEAFSQYPQIRWALGNADDLTDDGVVAYEPALPSGLVAKSALMTFAKRIQPAGIMADVDLAIALGGWLGVASGEDWGLVGALCELAPGYFCAASVWLWRRHAGQSTKALWWQASGTEDTTSQRIAALRSCGLVLPDAHHTTSTLFGS
jgi:hypothetical protein